MAGIVATSLSKKARGARLERVVDVLIEVARREHDNSARARRSGPSEQPASGDAVEARHRMSITMIRGAQARFWTRHLPGRLDIICTCEYKCE